MRSPSIFIQTDANLLTKKSILAKRQLWAGYMQLFVMTKHT